MKKAFLIALLVQATIGLYAQTLGKLSLAGEPFDGNTYSIVRKDSTGNSQKFLNAKQWLTRVFNDYKEAVQFEDAASGRIVVKGTLPVDYSFDGNDSNIEYHPSLGFTFTVDVKTDRYRLRLDDIAVTVIRTEQAPLGERSSKAEYPISEYVAKFKSNSFERMNVSASITSFINSAVASIELADDF